MPTTTCPACRQSYDDEELLCPHCGAAQIPQASKFDLSRQQAVYRQAPRGAKVGALCGLLAGILLAVTAGPSLPPSGGMGEIALLVSPVAIGLVAGLVVQRLLRK
jgi:hypothetical protein